MATPTIIIKFLNSLEADLMLIPVNHGFKINQMKEKKGWAYND